MNSSIVSISQDLPSPHSVRGLPLDQKRTIAIYGGLGALPERFLAAGFAEVQALFPNVRFVAVDKVNSNVEAERIASRMSKIQLPWREVFPYVAVDQLTLTAGSSFLVDNNTIIVDGVITAVPTSVHLSITEQWASRGALVWVDKPITMIHEVRQIRSLSAKHPSVFAVDFFLDSDAMAWFLMNSNELLSRIGRVTALHGRLIESWPVEKELGQRVWLLTPELSGGGLGIDQAVHQLAMLSPIVDGLGLKLSDAEITQVVMGGNDPLRTVETAFWCKGRIGDVELLCDCGKGVEDTYYGVTIVGQNGTIEICVGTEEVDPYVRVTEPKGTTVYRFENGQIGYGRTWLDYLLLLYGGQPKGLGLQQRLDACTGAVEVVGNAYALHTKCGSPLIHHEVGLPLPVPTKVLGRIASEVPRSKQRTWAQ